jgi:hypothetical protein
MCPQRIVFLCSFICVVCKLFFYLFCSERWYHLLWPKITSGYQDCDYSPQVGRVLFSFNESDEPVANDILLSQEQAYILVICDWIPPLPSILLANVQYLDNKIDDLDGRLNHQRDIQTCNILCFTETWLNDDTINIQLAGYKLHQ